jgi:hypothetical protein
MIYNKRIKHLEKHSSSANQQNSPRFMENEVPLRVHNSTTTVPIPSQINPVHTLQTDWISILLLTSYLHLGFSSGLFPTGFLTDTLYAPLPPYMPSHASWIVSFRILAHLSFNIKLPSDATQPQLLKTSFDTPKKIILSSSRMEEWRNPCEARSL